MSFFFNQFLPDPARTSFLASCVSEDFLSCQIDISTLNWVWWAVMVAVIPST
jgi:hypothetical protein